MLVSATEIINKAHEGHYAIGAFNTNNLEWTKSLLKAAQDAKAPIIIQTSEGAAKYMGGFKMVV
ncbi:MAG: class II fructose-bisphosphate aldolase, partial [Bacilli bacterium]|nr:class II fructose-bisphosphate aldolase [Bacilli bacterium]